MRYYYLRVNLLISYLLSHSSFSFLILYKSRRIDTEKQESPTWVGEERKLNKESQNLHYKLRQILVRISEGNRGDLVGKGKNVVLSQGPALRGKSCETLR